MMRPKTLGLISARGGSKGLPRKNVLSAGGKPLLAWTAEAAKASNVISDVVLSSDDDEIITAGVACGCSVPFRRPESLAGDAVASIDVVLHALETLPSYEYVALLQPTSPLRTAADIDAAFALMAERAAPCCVSVCESEDSPYWMYFLSEDKRLNAVISSSEVFKRRQDLPPSFVLNGAIYIAKTDWLLEKKTFLCPETVAYLMPKDRSLDIDTVEDFQLFKSIVE